MKLMNELFAGTYCAKPGHQQKGCHLNKKATKLRQGKGQKVPKEVDTKVYQVHPNKILVLIL